MQCRQQNTQQHTLLSPFEVYKKIEEVRNELRNVPRLGLFFLVQINPIQTYEAKLEDLTQPNIWKITANKMVNWDIFFEEVKTASNKAYRDISSSAENYSLRASINNLIEAITDYQQPKTIQQPTQEAYSTTSDHIEQNTSSNKSMEAFVDVDSIQMLESKIFSLEEKNRRLHSLLQESELQHEETKKILNLLTEEREKFYSENQGLKGVVCSLENRIEQLSKEVSEQDKRNSNLISTGNSLVEAGVQLGQLLLPQRRASYPNFLQPEPIYNALHLAVTNKPIEYSSNLKEGTSPNV